MVQPIVNKRKLAVFGFDDTIIEDNCDLVLRRLFDPSHRYKFNPEKDSWTRHMENVFRRCYRRHIMKPTIIARMKSIKPISGFKKLIQTLSEKSNYDIVIIGETNVVFIEEWMRCANLFRYVTEIFSNPAMFDDSGKFSVQPYKYQTSCQYCPTFLCKGSVIDKFVAQQKQNNVTYENKILIGVNRSDFCSALKMKENDIIFPRAGHLCHAMLEKNQQRKPLVAGSKIMSPLIKSTIIPWRTGDEINKFLSTNMKYL